MLNNLELHVINWQKVIEHFCTSVSTTSKAKKCGVKTLDTIVFNALLEPQRYFTNQSGNVSKTKTDNSKILPEFSVRCVKFALANPYNRDKIVAMRVDSSGNSVHMNELELNTFISDSNNIQTLANSESFLQTYLHPADGIDIIYVCTSTHIRIDDEYDHDVSTVIRTQRERKTPSLSEINEQIIQSNNEIIRCLSHNIKCCVKSITAEYIVDDNLHAWLSRVSHCVIGPSVTNDDLGSPSKNNSAVRSVHTTSGDIALNHSQSVKIGIADQGASTNSIDGVPSGQQSRSVSASTATNKLRNVVSEQRLLPVADENIVEAKQQKLAKVYGTSDAQVVPATVNDVTKGASVTTSKLGLKKDIINRKKLKKDKTLNTSTGSESSGFRRSQMDAPPSYELMAKFAAEKEQQLLLQQQSVGALDDDESWVAENRKNVNPNRHQHQAQQQNVRGNKKTSPKKQQQQQYADQYLPLGSVESIDHNEKRLAELERLAAIRSYASQQQQQLPFGANGYPLVASQVHSSIGSRANMSGSEADFLVRQINTADVSQQQSLFSNLDLDGFETVQPQTRTTHHDSPQKYNNNLNGGGSIASVASTKDVMTAAFTERIASLERQLATVQATADKKEGEIEKRDAKLKKLTLELETVRRDAQNDLKRLQSEHEVEILRIREQHSKEKAALASATAISSNSSHPSSPTTKQSGITSQHGDNSSGGNSKLIEQLETLRLEMRRLQDSFADERRSMQIDYSNKLLLQERKLKAEIMELKSASAVLEDRITTGNEELSSALGTIQQLKNLSAQLELNKREAVDMQQKLRADLKNMQQSVQASYRLETSQHLLQSSGAVAADPEAAMRLNDAKNEAKSRQLQNKIEFLKSQFEAEKKNNDDLKQAMDLTKQKLDEIREEFKFRMQEAERNKQTAVEEAEQRVEMMYEDRMREYTTLQSRVMSLQGQLQDVSTEHMLSKQLEEKQKAATIKQIAIATTLKTELEQQRVLIAQLRDEKEMETVKDSNKSNNDAIIRRLDNERQYLKSQLTSEITHKNEMQNELTKCSQQIKEIQKQWNDDVITLKDSLQLEQQRQRERENQYKAMETSLMSELSSSKQQLKDLKEGFVKTRDLLRMEQLNSENTTTANRRLTEQLELAHSDIAQLKSQDQQNALSYKQHLEAINSTIREAEAVHNKEIASLKEELSRQYLANSSDQNHIMDIRERHADEKMKITRLVHTTKMVNIFNKWKMSRVYIAFRLWNTNTTLVSVAGQFRSQVEDMLKANTDEMNQEQTRALEIQMKKLNKEHAISVSLLKDEFEHTLQDALHKAADDKQNALDAAYSDYQSQAQQLETDFTFDLNKTRQDCASEIRRLTEDRDIQFEAMIEKHKEQAVIAKELAHEQLLKAEDEKEQAMNALWTDRLRQQEAEQHAAQIKTLATAQMDYECMLDLKQTEHKQELATLKSKLDLHLQVTIEGLEAKHQQLAEEMLLEKHKELREMELKVREEEAVLQQQQRAEMHEASEARIRELREVWQSEFDDTMAVKSKEFDAKLVEKMEEYSRTMDIEKQRAVKLENSKWKQAIKDIEQTNELTVMKVRSEVMQQKDAEYKIELEKANNRFETQKQKEFALHLEVIEDIKKEHKLAFERQTNKFELQCEVLRVEVESSVKQSYDAVWNDKMRHLLQESEAGWKAKLAKEKEKSDNLRDDLAKQSAHYAEERTTLQRSVAKCDDRVAAMEELNKSEMNQLRAGLEAEREMFKFQEEENRRQLRAVFDKEKAELAVEIEEQFKVVSENAIRAEKERLNAEFEQQMNEVQDESDKLITNLETAMSGLKTEKQELTKQLETLTVKLEDTEDILYDLQQESKRVTKEASLTLWKSVTNTIKMQQRFQRGIEDFDVEAKKRMDAMKREMQSKLNDCVLLVMKLTSLIQEVESNRKKSYSILTAYKSEDIASKRTAIRLLEKELERINLESNSLEEQRDLMESEVVQLEGQVRELEDHIREHNRESSMSNGRINVAHARKKRRLDSELERMLESIEQKRHNMTSLDQRVAEKGRERDDKELDMIDIEKQLMGILLEQQKHVMSTIDENKIIEDKCKMLLNIARLPFPVSATPTINDVLAHQKERDMLEELA